jgi:signal transduction histidine kinase
MLVCLLPYIHAETSDLSLSMLQDFLKTNRTILIDRCRAMVADSSEPKKSGREQAHGIPAFLDQLIDTLTIQQRSAPPPARLASVAAGPRSSEEIAEMAMLHGRDLFEQGFTLEQVVRDYGNICQSVTNLAFETGAPIEVDEFRTFNRCLDNAIAAAVTEYADRQSDRAAEDNFEAVNSRLEPLARELLNYLQTAVLVVRAIKAGNVGISGATGAVLDRSLLGMRNLIDHALAEVRVTAGMLANPRPIHLAQFLGEVAASALQDSQAHGCHFTLTPVDNDLTVFADSEMLSSAITNLLQNAFKFTKRHTEVRLHAHVDADRILIDVEDHSGGPASQAAEKTSLALAQSGEDQSARGFGLDVCRRSIAINKGILRVRDVPGSGRIFTIDLPRHATAGGDEFGLNSKIV